MSQKEIVNTRTQSKLKDKIKDLLNIPSTLMVIFVTTFLMRASFYLALSLLNYPYYLTHLSDIQRTLVFIVYPLAELLSVMFFGMLSDKVGRKIIYFTGLGITSLAIFLFAFMQNFALLLVISSILGIGAAAQVASTLAIVADMAPEDKRGRFMGYYDAMTLVGLGGGFGGGFLILEILFGKYSENDIPYDQVNLVAHILFLIAAGVLLISLIVAIILLKGHHFVDKSAQTIPLKERFKYVVSDKNLRYLMPVWVPIICLYAIVLRHAEDLAHELNLHDIKLLIVLAIIFLSIFIGFPINGILSDKIGRKPFLYIGMFSFAVFVSLLVVGAEQTAKGNSNFFFYLLPVLLIFGIGCGAFPPAALALLAELSPKENYGTTMGAYSLVYGTGMIIGPVSATYAKMLGDNSTIGGTWGIIILVWLLCMISVIGTLVLPKHLLSKEKK